MAGLGHGHGGHGHHANITIDWDSIKWDELSQEEKWNYEHLRMHQKHAGHAEMHAEMILILIVVLIVSQICLVQWKKWKPYSYHLCTLIGNIPLYPVSNIIHLFARYVDHSSGFEFKEPLVEVSLHLVGVFFHYISSHQTVLGETDPRNNP